MKNILARFLILSALALVPFQAAHALGFGSPVNRISTSSIASATNVFEPSDATGATDMTSELDTFLSTHSGVAHVKTGTTMLLAEACSSIASTADCSLICETPGTCTIKNNNDHYAVYYNVPDNIAFDSKTLATAAPTTATINKDDVLQYVAVSSVSGYSVGDYAKIIDSISLPSRIGSTKTISGVTWDAGNSKCVVTTSSSHGYTSTQKIFLKDIVATVGATKIDYLDGSDGLGRLYNITPGDGSGANTSTKFTLQTIDNSNDTSTGSDVNCNTGTYSSGGTTSRQDGWVGEAVQISGVDTVNKRLYFTHKLKYPSLYVYDAATGNVPVVFRYTRARKFNVDGFKFTANGDTSDVTLATSLDAVWVQGVPEARFANNRCENTWDACITIAGSPNYKVFNQTSFNLPNRATIAADAAGATVTSATRATPAVFTAVAHGFSNNKEVAFTSVPTGWSSIQNKIYRVVNKTNDTFELADTYGNEIDSSAFSNAWSGTAVTSSTDDVTGLGYAMRAYGTDYGGVVNGIEMWNGRHGFTTDGTQLSWATNISGANSVWRIGQPTYLTIENGVAHGAYGIPWDTHEEGAEIVFRNISCYYPERGAQFGSYQSRCVQIRAKDVTVDGLIQVGGMGGIRISSVEHDTVPINRFNNIEISNTVAAGTTLNTSCSGSATGYDFGFSLCTDASITNIPINYVTNFRTYNVAFPIDAFEKTKISVDNAVFRDFQGVVDKFAGAQVTLRGVTASESTNTHTGSYNYIMRLRSDGSNDTGNKAVIQGLKVVKGSNADYPRHIFDENDTTATKNYFLDGFEEENSSAVTDTLLLESGSTTLSLLSTISNPLQPFDIVATIEAPTNKAYTMLYNADFGGTIMATKTICSSGTATVTFKINTTALGGAANAASSSGDSVTQSTSNVFVAGDKISATVSSNAACADLNLTVKYKRAL